MADKRTEHLEQHEEDIYDTEIADEDYGFIIGPDGELKSVFLPTGFVMEPPKRIKKILKLFGIKDIEEIDQDITLH